MIHRLLTKLRTRPLSRRKCDQIMRDQYGAVMGCAAPWEHLLP